MFIKKNLDNLFLSSCFSEKWNKQLLLREMEVNFGYNVLSNDHCLIPTHELMYMKRINGLLPSVVELYRTYIVN